MEKEIRPLEIGKGELLRDGKDIAIIAIGNTVVPALKAAQDLAPLGIDAAVVNARFVKPLDSELLLDVLERIPRAITVEDNVVQGGFGSAVAELLADEGMTGVSLRRLGVPDRFIPHGTQDELRKICGIDKDAIAQATLRLVRGEKKKKRRDGKEGAVR
jgi:1-deoxy-D-xylulose-5-phosphate synthase